jgi:hypothetical protein
MNENPATVRRSWNWRIWVGFLAVLAAFVSYPLIFYRYPITRNFPWVNWLLFFAAAWLLCAGVQRARREVTKYRGKIAGIVLVVLSAALAALFAFGTIYATRLLPASKDAPRVGAKAPEFSLTDTSGKTITLAELLSEPMPEKEAAGAKPRAVALIFYRGYW